jgi:hypothetical protein
VGTLHEICEKAVASIVRTWCVITFALSSPAGHKLLLRD